MKTIAKNSFFNTVNTILDFAVSIWISMQVSRSLLAEGIGQIARVQNIVGYFSTFAGFAISTYGIREMAQAREKSSDVERLFTELMIINFVTTTCALVAYLMFGLWSGQGQSRLYLVCGLTVFFNYLNFDWIFQGNEEYGYIVVRNAVVKILTLLAVFIYVKTETDGIKYALIMSCTAGCTYLVNLTCVHRYVKPVWKKVSPKKHLKPLLLLASGEFSTSLYTNITITILGRLCSDAEIGYYDRSNAIVTMALSIFHAAAWVFFPRLGYYYKTDRRQFCDLMQLELKWVIFLTVPAWSGILLLSPEIVTLLYGNAFFPSVNILRILALLILVSPIFNVLTYQVILVMRKERVRVSAYFVAMLGRMGLGILLIPHFGGVGAAAAIIISEAAVGIYLIWKVRQLYAFSFPWRVARATVAGAGVMAISVYGILRLIEGLLLKCIVGVLTGVVVYGIVNLVLQNELMIPLLEMTRKRLKFRPWRK